MPNPYLDPYDPDAKWGAVGATLGGAFGGPIGGALGGWIGGKFGGGGKPDVIDVNQDDLTPAPFANGVGGYTIPQTPATPANSNPWTTHSKFTSDSFNPTFGNGFDGQTPLSQGGYGGWNVEPNTGGDGNYNGVRQPPFMNYDPFPGGATMGYGNVGSTPAAPASSPNPFLSGAAASDYSHLFQNPTPKPKQNPFTFF